MHTNIFLLLMFSTLIVLALFGNLLVVAAIFWDRHLRRQPENLFLVSLALSDLLVSILVMLFAAANDLLGYWPFGSAYCQFWISFDITCSTASILNLCAISLDRYCHISRPMVYVRYCNRRRISYAIFFVWFLSGLIGAAPMAFGFGSKVTMHNSTRLPVCEMRLPLSYAICSSMMSFFLPAAMMVFLYTKLYLYARKHVRSIQTQLKQATSFLIMQLASEKIREDDGEDSCDEATAATLRTGPLVSQRVSTKRVSTSISTGESPARVHMSRGAPWESVKRFLHLGRSPSPIIEETPSHPRATVSDQKARLTLGVIMGTFLVCWLPFFLVNIWRSWDPSVFSVFTSQAVTWLGYANSTANPVIYSIFNRDFRRAFKKILFEIFHCCEDKKMNSNYRNGCLEHQNDRRKSYTRSSEANNDNNNIVDAPVATRLVLLNNNESSVIVEE